MCGLPLFAEQPGLLCRAGRQPPRSNVLKKHLHHSQQAEKYWRDILHMGKLKPSPLEAYFEAVNWMFPINFIKSLKLN